MKVTRKTGGPLRRFPLARTTLAGVFLASAFVSIGGASEATPSPTASPITVSTGAGSSAGQVTFTGALPSWASAGSTLEALVWPSMPGAAAGASFPMTELSSEEVSGASFTDPVATQGNINLAFVLTNGTQSSIEFSTVGEPPQNSAPLAGPHVATTPTKIRLKAFPAPLQGVPASRLRHELSSGVRSAAATPHVLYIDSCVATVLSNTGRTWTNIGEVHTTADTSASYDFGISTGDSFTIGYSATGSSGSFSVDGSTSTTAGGGSALPVAAGIHQAVQTQFIYTSYELGCGAGKYAYTAYAVAESNWSGGMQLGASVGTDPNGGCNSLHDIILSANGGNADLYYGTTDTIDTGFSLLGFNFSNSVTYGTQDTTTWINNGTPTTYLCGADNNISPIGQPVIYNSTSG